MDAQVIIVGGGPVGLVVAGLLAGRNIECLLLDAGTPVQEMQKGERDAKVLALTPASRNILASLECWNRIPRERLGHFNRMHVWDENGSGEIQLCADDIQLPALGYIVEQSALQATIEPLLSDLPKLDIRHENKVLALDAGAGRISVKTTAGVYQAKLVIAADGVGSACREIMGIGVRRSDYRQKALTCVVRTEREHGETARQRFLADGPLALLPLAEPDYCGIVWSSSPLYTDLLCSMNDGEFQHVLAKKTEHCLGAILECGARTVFPLQRVEAESYCRDRFVLIGDAAHNIHPLAGMGANLGFLDAASLAEVLLDAAAHNKDLGRLHILKRYQRRRQLDNRLMMLLMEAFKYAFEDQTPPLPTLRNMGLDLADSVNLLKQWLMKQAVGIGTELPESARFQPGIN